MYRATVTYLRGGYPTTEIITTTAASRLDAARAINRRLTELRSDCREVSREITRQGMVYHADRTFLQLIGRIVRQS